jgi:hypothetical protein
MHQTLCCFVSTLIVSSSTQATPRLGEDKVKQCIDPRLNGEYPPKGVAKVCLLEKLGNFRYILIPEIINMFMTNISDPVRAKHVLVFKLNLK